MTLTRSFKAAKRLSAAAMLAAAATLMPMGQASAMDMPASGVAGAAQHANLSAILSQAPAQSQVVIVIPSLSGLSQKIAALGQSLGVHSPMMANVLGAFKQQSGMVHGINDKGSVVVALLDVDQAVKTHGEPTALVLMPVSDYNAFLGNFQNAKAAGDVTSFNMKDGETAYARHVGNYAVMGPKEAAVKAYQPGGAAVTAHITQTIGQMGGKYLSMADVAIYADLQKLGPVFADALANELKQTQQRFAGIPGTGNRQAMMKLYEQGLSRVLRDAVGGVVTADLSADGIGLNEAYQFKPGSKTLAILHGGSAETPKALQRLPKEPYIFAGAVDTQAIRVFELLKPLVDIAGKGGANPMTALYKDIMPQLEQATQMAFAWYAPPAGGRMGPGQGLFRSVSVLATPHPDQYIAAMKKSVLAGNGVTIPMANVPVQPGQPAPQIKMTTQYQDNALQIDGTKIDRYSMQMQFPPNMGRANPMMMMFGGTTVQGYLAAQNGFVIDAKQADKNLLQAALQSVAKDNGLGSAGLIAQLRDKALPPHPAAEGYFNLAGLYQTLAPMAMMWVGAPLPPAPKNLPPIAMGIGIDQTDVAARLYVPVPVMKFVADTVMQVRQQMQQRMQRQFPQPNGGGEPQPQPHPPAPF